MRLIHLLVCCLDLVYSGYSSLQEARLDTPDVRYDLTTSTIHLADAIQPCLRGCPLVCSPANILLKHFSLAEKILLDLLKKDLNQLNVLIRVGMVSLSAIFESETKASRR